MVVAQREVTGSQPTKLAVIDCDIHVAPKNEKVLGKYMPERWRQHHERFGGRGHAGSEHPRANHNAARTGSSAPTRGADRPRAADRRAARVGPRLPARAAARRLADGLRGADAAGRLGRADEPRV